MSRIYSVDLRKKVLSAIDNGSKAVALSKLFQIDRKTIYNWQNKLKKLKSLEPIKIGPRILSRKIQDLDTFKKFVQKKPDRSSSEIAEEWGDISSSTIRRYLKIIGFTNKKKVLVTKIAAKKNEKNS